MKVFSDYRGDITDFENGVQFITCNPDTRRASHYHKTSGHDCYVVIGSIWYYERPVGSQEKPTLTVYEAGALFSTGPNVEHLMVFHEESEFICFRTGGSFTAEEYENDLVRFDHDLEAIFHAD